jgi:hypothetical protein
LPHAIVNKVDEDEHLNEEENFETSPLSVSPVKLVQRFGEPVLAEFPAVTEESMN